MANLFIILRKLLSWVLRLLGMTSLAVEIEPGTLMNIWFPRSTLKKKNKPDKQPSVVLLHGFAADGILTWVFQIFVLVVGGKYEVYVPDLLFFGGSTTDNTAGRSTRFQAECVAKCLRKLGVDTCMVVGLSYGGMVGFRMAEMYPELVESLVVSATVVELTDSISRASLEKIGFKRWSDYLLPQSADGVKVLFSIGSHKLPWLPPFVYRHFLEAMFDNRKERAELLDALVVPDKDATEVDYSQRIGLLWGDDDKIFGVEVADAIKRQVGKEKATLRCIEQAGHLALLERPFLYSRYLLQILESPST